MPSIGSRSLPPSSCRFKDLVSLIQQHYNTLPSESGWIDVYYWIDIFAVQQNFTGAFTMNPDSDFLGEEWVRRLKDLGQDLG